MDSTAGWKKVRKTQAFFKIKKIIFFLKQPVILEFQPGIHSTRQSSSPLPELRMVCNSTHRLLNTSQHTLPKNLNFPSYLKLPGQEKKGRNGICTEISSHALSFQPLTPGRENQVKTALTNSKEIQRKIKYNKNIPKEAEKLFNFFPSNHSCNCCCPLFTFILQR